MLAVPKELTVDKDKLSVKMPAKEQKIVNFEIEKFSALAGSSYVVFAIVEYDEKGMQNIVRMVRLLFYFIY